ncbi:MAG: response regulator [Candidatus Omnitrophota bacterium]
MKNKKTILLVDDETNMINMLGNLIERKGKKALIAYTGGEAIDLYKKNKPHCVFLDIMLPDLHGVEVLKKIQEIDLSAKVYFMSGIIDNTIYSTKEKIKELGIIDYISKPIDLTKLMAIIETL